MEITFYKYQGTGNDFIIIDNREELYNNIISETIKHLCNRKFGIGADGLMLLNNKTGYDFEMIYYNADGNPSTMCGNGGRCMIRFANNMGIHKTVYSFLAIDGEHEGEIDQHKSIRLKMNNVSAVKDHLSHAILDTGSPHYVKFITDVRRINVKEEGAEIRYSKAFKDNGINVNFVENIGPASILVRTYERGVEDETLSCGTGVTAAALMSAHNDLGFNEVNVQTPGGKLTVEFTKINEHTFADIWLCGPADFVFTGTVNI